MRQWEHFGEATPGGSGAFVNEAIRALIQIVARHSGHLHNILLRLGAREPKAIRGTKIRHVVGHEVISGAVDCGLKHHLVVWIP